MIKNCFESETCPANVFLFLYVLLYYIKPKTTMYHTIYMYIAPNVDIYNIQHMLGDSNVLCR